MLMGEPQFLLQVALVGLAARYLFECPIDLLHTNYKAAGIKCEKLKVENSVNLMHRVS